MHPSQHKQDPVFQLRRLQSSIHQKLNRLSNLNSQYREKQEKQFLKVFLHVMDKMSTELSQAQEQYLNIDREIQKDEKCVQLSTKLSFFKNQSLFLRMELENTQNEIEREKEKQKQILQMREHIQAQLFQTSKQICRYKLKARSYSKELMSHCTRTKEMRPSFYSQTKSSSLEKSVKERRVPQNLNNKISSLSHLQTGNSAQCEDEKANDSQFRVKAAKLAKQRKILMNKSYYTSGYLNKKRNSPVLLI